jgi:hypothetical protein
MLLNVSSTRGIYGKPYSTLALKIHTKNSQNDKNLESIHK